MARLRITPKQVFDINDVRKYEGSWLICIPGCGRGSVIISSKGKLMDEPTGTEFTEEEIAQIGCFDEEYGTSYKRI